MRKSKIVSVKPLSLSAIDSVINRLDQFNRTEAVLRRDRRRPPFNYRIDESLVFLNVAPTLLFLNHMERVCLKVRIHPSGSKQALQFLGDEMDRAAGHATRARAPRRTGRPGARTLLRAARCGPVAGGPRADPSGTYAGRILRPQIAQTIVHLGVNLGEVTTKATLADAFRVALQRTGARVTICAASHHGHAARFLRCAYQAMVMNVFEAASKRIVSNPREIIAPSIS